MSIQIDGNTTVRELVGRFPQTRKVFEQYGIDYCCGGGKCLAEAARENQAALPDLVRDIETALVETSTRTATAEKDWYAAPLHELIDHILQVHHAYMKEALPRLRGLVRKVLHAHGCAPWRYAPPGAGPVQRPRYRTHQPFTEGRGDSLPIHRGCRGASPGRPGRNLRHVSDRSAIPSARWKREHESAGEALAQIRKVTGGYALPDDACPTFRALYEELEHMEEDLHQHIHLENNILFPKAIAMESST